MEQRVYFDGGFDAKAPKKYARAGKRIALEKYFQWNEEEWYIPAMYVCSEGVVIDFCRRVAPEKLQAFQENWPLHSVEDLLRLTKEERLQRTVENPLICASFTPYLYINGKQSPQMRGVTESWNPIEPRELYYNVAMYEEKMQIAQQMGCAMDAGWIFHRMSFVWPTKRKPKLSTATLRLEHDKQYITGEQFQINHAGEQIPFEHPITKQNHVLTVLSYQPEVVAEQDRQRFQYLLPHCCTELQYEITPPLERSSYSLSDCVPADAPRDRQQAANLIKKEVGLPEAKNDCIVWATYDRTKTPDAATVYSSLHFEPTDNVLWQFTFQQQLYEDVELELCFV